MKTTITINGKPVQIELTKEQVNQIKKQSVRYTDIKTFEDACDFVGVDSEEFEESYGHLPTHVYAYMQLTIISQALNGGTNMNYDDTDEYKYYPYFYAKGSDVGFSFRGCGCYVEDSNVASRLTYKSREIAKYAGEQFLDIYDKYING